MCFTNSDRSDEPAPRPVQIPQREQRPSASMPRLSKAYMPQDFTPPPGPPPSQSHGPSTDYAPPPGPPPSHRPAEDYAPPPGPPPSHDYAPPAGPPPSKATHNPFYDDNIQPPPGPPPSSQDYAPPPGPPPSHSKKAGDHDWETAVPDTSLLPPPPNFFSGFDRSPANNATEEEAEAGERWCREFPLSYPLSITLADLNATNSGNINMFTPPFYRGTLNREAVGVWRGQSPRGGTDTHLATYPPLYSVSAHSPLATGRRKFIYYEVRILVDSGSEVSLALGYTAPPYPPFRLPGWHRASLGVHGDDGNKYINDRWGGKSFTHPFRRGETLGLGMEFIPAPGGGIRVEIFFTRDGVESGRWDLHEETDQNQDLPVTGLEGFHDICAAVGVFDKVSFEIVFVPEKWRWQYWKTYRN
ncbi:hypothetical protein GGR50DRAFT_686982 [Xylaria sp. CBS 124048]|nr:hypothetical protein GGR50DRAFT_686982 [Xylaria sp. CBS 124048]